MKRAVRKLSFFWSVMVTVGLTAACQNYKSGIGGAGGEGGSEGSDLETFQSRNLISTQLGLQPKEIVLTFDDGPGAKTLELAKFLQAEGAPATFFMQGEHVSVNEGLVKEISEKSVGGSRFTIGNHTWGHVNLKEGTSSADMQEILRTDNFIKKYVKGAYFFRAPYGEFPFEYLKQLNASSLVKYIGPVFWDIGGKLTSRHAADWNCWSAGVSVADCAKRYQNETMDKGGGILLAHDVHDKTFEMMKILIPKLKAAGFKFVSIEKYSEKIAELSRNPNAPGNGGTAGTVLKVAGFARAVGGTRLKKETKDASALPAAAQCAFPMDQVVEFSSIEDLGNGHVLLKVDTPPTVSCPADFWKTKEIFVYKQHLTFVPRQCSVASKDGTANVRSSPQTSGSANIVTRLKTGAVFQPEAHDPLSWYRFVREGQKVYIHRSMLDDLCKNFPY